MRHILLAVCVFVWSLGVAAQTTVKVYWPFPVGDGQSLYLRSVLDQANRMQTQFVFVLISTPGAGGLVAVNNARNSPSVTLLAHTSSYFIRPLVYQQGRYDFASFRPLIIVGETPFAVVAQKTHTGSFTKIGVAGLGSTTHVISLVIKSRQPDLEIIPYKGLTDSLHEVRNGMIHASLNFVRAIEQYDDLVVVGTTGTQQIKSYPLLKNVFAKDMAHLSAPLFLMSRHDMDAAQFTQLQSILLAAKQADQQLRRMIEQDYAVLSDLGPDQYDSWYQQQIVNYTKFVQGIRLD